MRVFPPQHDADRTKEARQRIVRSNQPQQDPQGDPGQAAGDNASHEVTVVPMPRVHSLSTTLLHTNERLGSLPQLF